MNLFPLIFFNILTNSYKHPAMMKINKEMKLKAFINKPVSITITNTNAVNALVLNVWILIANLIEFVYV